MSQLSSFSIHTSVNALQRHVTLFFKALVALHVALAWPANAQMRERYVTEDDGQQRAFVVALDEFHTQDRDRKPRRQAMPPVAAAEAVRLAAERHRQQTGEEAEVVLYEEGVPRTSFSRRVLTKQIAVRLKADANPAALAAKLGLMSKGPLAGVPGWFIFETGMTGGGFAAAEALRAEAGVEAANPQLSRLRAKRLLPNDPLFSSQWHLRNTDVGANIQGIDVRTVWDTWRGSGIRIGIIDDGIQTTHPDLSANIDTLNDHNWLDGTPDDANPRVSLDWHGTAVAGVAAARGYNGVGVSGVAPEATLVGLRLIVDDIPTSDAEEAEAMAWKNDIIQIKNNSWGPPDNGSTLGGAGTLTRAALSNAVQTGRGGLGTIFVWAGGNGRDVGDNSNYDSFANSIYTIAVAAADESGVQVWDSERGANLIVTAHSDKLVPAIGLVTTDITGPNGYNSQEVSEPVPDDYTRLFYSTSASAPMVAGCVALLLQSKPTLGWRDVQEILIRSAMKNHPTDTDWRTNAAGWRFNHKYGAGFVNAQAAVVLASNWVNLAPQQSIVSAQTGLNVAIPDNDPTGITRTFTIPSSMRVERVTVTVNINHTSRGQLGVTLTSPGGMPSVLAETHGDTGDNYSNWTFSTVRCWGEEAAGNWTLKITDNSVGTTGTLTSATLTVHGVASADSLLTPVAISTSTAFDLGSVDRLIDGSGLSGMPTPLSLGTHAPPDIGNSWITAGVSYPGDYFAANPAPELTCTLPPGMHYLSELVLWGYGGNHNEAKAFSVSLSTDGVNYGTPVSVSTTNLVGTAAARLVFPGGPRQATHVKVAVTDNYYAAPGTFGGDRVAFGELRFIERAPIVVNTLTDQFDTPSGSQISLREALRDAAALLGADIVTFDPALNGQSIQLASQITIADTGGVTVDASALASGITITDTGAVNYRMFQTGSNSIVIFRCLTFKDGGGNAASDSGAAVHSRTGATVSIERCTFTGNRCAGGGAIYNEAGAGLMTVFHCTFSGNIATQEGGAIFNHGSTMSLTHCTISGNTAGANGGISGGIINYLGTLNLTNCIVAGNTHTSGSPNGDVQNHSNTLNLGGANIIPALINTATLTGPAPITSAPLLSPLANWGGGTRTMIPLPGSPARDAATVVAGLSTDQRGAPLPGILRDIGAVEISASVPGLVFSPVTTAADELNGLDVNGISLREAVIFASAGGTITFAPALNGQTITLAGGEIVLGSSVTIDGSGLTNGLILDGGPGTNRIFTVNSGQAVTLKNLTLTGGTTAAASNGGAVLNNGTLTVEGCTLHGNAATYGGAAIFNAGTLTVSKSTFFNNTAGGSGGAIQTAADTTTTLSQCTLAGNTCAGAGNAGGAIRNNGALTLNHCTFSGNSMPENFGGGIYNEPGRTITMAHCILHANAGGDISSFGTVNVSATSIIGTLTGSGSSSGGILTNNPLLAPLGNYGGATRTIALLPGSPARNAATGSSITNDQRGFLIVGTPDIGAYEAGTFSIFNAWVWETLVPASADHSALVDPDGDGQSNTNEWRALTDPGDSCSALAILSIARNAGGHSLITFQSVPGLTYRMEYSSNLVAWPVATTNIPSGGTNTIWTDDGTFTGGLSSSNRHYRVGLP